MRNWQSKHQSRADQNTAEGRRGRRPLHSTPETWTVGGGVPDAPSPRPSSRPQATTFAHREKVPEGRMRGIWKQRLYQQLLEWHRLPPFVILNQ
jgi:hypothetical protein